MRSITLKYVQARSSPWSLILLIISVSVVNILLKLCGYGTLIILEARLCVRRHLLAEAVVQKVGHGAVEVALDAVQVVALVRVDLLPEEHTLGGQRLGQHHRLLQVHVVVRGAVDQVKHLITKLVGAFRHVRLVVALVVGCHVRRPHVPLGVHGICKNTTQKRLFLYVMKRGG
jgi:hypothetical protein